MDTTYLIDEYVTVTPGEPYRLFPFGRLVKGGVSRDITPELARKFRLPHFRPPIKRGGHADNTPAGGHITGLEVREDGLWCIPEFNENGLQDVRDGAYRYHSPEVIWDEGPVFEDPSTGLMIHGPLIVGDALLHMPHLGEAAALYSVEPITTEENKDMAEEIEMVSVPRKWYDVLFDVFRAKQVEPVAPVAETPNSIEPDDYQALVVKAQLADKLQTEMDSMKAEAEKAARVEKFTAELKATKANGEFAGILAGLDSAVADRIVQEFKALSAQINEGALIAVVGTEGEGLPSDPTEALNAAVHAKMAELKVNYNQALAQVTKEAPELVIKYQEGK
jgi:hypothetical protein